MSPATFHYSSKLQTWLQTWLSTRFAARFSTSSCGLATCFRHVFATLSTFLSKTWSRTCCINLDVRSSLGFKQVCSWLSTCFRHAFDLLATCGGSQSEYCHNVWYMPTETQEWCGYYNTHQYRRVTDGERQDILRQSTPR